MDRPNNYIKYDIKFDNGEVKAVVELSLSDLRSLLHLQLLRDDPTMYKQLCNIEKDLFDCENESE